MASPLIERLASHPESFPGALLLSGSAEESLEKASLLLAASLLCPGDDPDRRCESCRRVLHAFHPDLLTVEPEGVQIRVDRVREAISFGMGRPYESRRRVVRISRAELAGVEAANALLKSLEEPGASLHWILTTTRPESLLPTVRSRCLAVAVASPSRDEQAAAWRSRGFDPEEAADLALLGPSSEEGAREMLEDMRRVRSDSVEALRAGLESGTLAPLILLAERLGRAEDGEIALFGGLLADAALLAASIPVELVRHRAVAGPLMEIGRRAGRAALERAALAVADVPADTRRGNRRLHFEKALIELWLTREA
ncbi:MAG: hypothetical protein M3542_02530 [Acidobacteriota bacterium]|nr:hypothetical protein [Acidobacteriota bacterium]MDQ5871031.1 hypothetical protein [Acidobacteriota bacterium]